jgi:dTDP-4-amino-4,6-dideoxygalactose transaminase
VDAVEQAITPYTKAIMPVHLNGRVCDMERLMAIAERHGLVVVEDAAQAVGASFNGTKAGAFGLAGCFSFYPAKVLGAYGDGGAVVTSSQEFAEKVKLLRNHGLTQDGDVTFWAFNSRLDNLHAAILDLKLKFLPDWIERRREIARLYYTLLSDLPQFHLPPPPVDEGPYYDVFQNYEIEAEDRDRLVQHLNREGIEVMLPWKGIAVHQFKALDLSHYKDRLPQTEALFKRVLMLPMHCELTDDQVAYAAQMIRDFYLK